MLSVDFNIEKSIDTLTTSSSSPSSTLIISSSSSPCAWTLFAFDLSARSFFLRKSLFSSFSREANKASSRAETCWILNEGVDDLNDDEDDHDDGNGDDGKQGL